MGQGLTVEDARRLVREAGQSPLVLDTKQLGSNAATILAAHDGDVYLNNMTDADLKDPTAEVLAKHSNPKKNANGKRHILALNGLTVLTERQIRAFAEHAGILSLTGLLALDDRALAKKLAEQHDKPEHGWLNLSGVIVLGDDAATELAKSPAPGIRLDHLKNLTNVKLAEKLARQEKDLVLDGLEQLSPPVAAELAQHTGFLSLRGVAELDDAAADALAAQLEPGTLCLSGLKKLTNGKLANKLGGHEGRLDLSGLSTLKVEVARELAKSTNTLRLNGLDTLPVEVARELSLHKGRLELDNLTTIDDDAAAAIAEHQGGLSLAGLTNRSPAAEQMLRANPGIELPDPKPPE